MRLARGQVVWSGLWAAVLSAGCASGAPLAPDPGAQGPTHLTPPATTPPPAPNDVPGGACPHTTDRFTFHIAGYGPHGFGCGAGTGKLVRSAVVTQVDSLTAQLTTCPPGTPCAETLTLGVTSPDFTVPLILGAFVQLEASVTETDDGCAQSIKVENLPSYGGVANPTELRPIVWFAGADGTLAASSDSLVHVDEAPGCGAESRPGFDDQQLSFSFSETHGAPPTTVVVPMGTPHVSVAPDGAAWTLRNLRSFRPDEAAPSDHRDFAYWIAYVATAQP